MKMKCANLIATVLNSGVQKSLVLKAVSSSDICCMRAMSTSSSSVSLKSSDVELSYTLYPTNNETVDPEKVPLFFLHGMFGAKGNLHSVAKHLSSTGRRLVTFDARNHGSSGHVDEMDYPSMAQDLHDLIDQLGFKKSAVLGHSMGGKTAMLCALQDPDIMSTLIVADVGPNTSPNISDMLRYMEAMKRVDIPQKAGLMKARKTIEMQLAPVVHPREILSFLLTNLVESNDGHIQWRMNLDSIHKNMENLMGFPMDNTNPFTKPTLFVFGAKSSLYKEADIGLIKSLFPSAQIEVIADAGHFLHVHKPLEFTSIVQEFLKTNSDGK